MTPLTADLVQDMPEVGTLEIEDVPETSDEQSSDDNRASSMKELQAILESMLFVSTEPLSSVRLTTAIGDVARVDVEEALRHLGQSLEQEGRGVRLVEVAGGYRIVTKQEYAPWIKRLDKAKTTAKLSRSALESLAIIAYKQPLIRSEIEEIRGVETSGVLRTLLERKLVKIVGRKEVPGRPIMYGTTKFFLEHFGLSDLSQLPPLREFKELGEAEQALLPIDNGDGPSLEESSVESSNGDAPSMAGFNGEASLVEGAIESVRADNEEQSMNSEVHASSQLGEVFDAVPAAQ